MSFPIPATCSHRPTTPDGLVIPYGNVQLADGGCDFRSHHDARWQECWLRRLCQVDGLPLRHPIVFLCGPRQLAQLLFDEPPVHAECARYVSQACPMVAGRRAHYRAGPALANRQRGKTCAVAGCDCGGWVPTPGTTAGSGGDPAHAWYAVYARSFSPAANPDGSVAGGICSLDEVLRVRLVAEPGRPMMPWADVPDWRDSYASPLLAEVAP